MVIVIVISCFMMNIEHKPDQSLFILFSKQAVIE